jgi:dipeptidyl aminopeptidase/acylaminoacyl peptidase
MNRISFLFFSLWAAAKLLSPDAGRAAEPAQKPRFQPLDVFQLEYAADPQISPDGKRIVYVRSFMDEMKDRRRSNLWILNSDGTDPRPLTTGTENDGSPRWSPDGTRLIYVSASDGGAQLWMRWMDTGQTAKITRLQKSPGSLSWSPDGRWIAFSMFVPDKPQPFVELPPKPEGAEWAPPPKLIRDMPYRADGESYLEEGYSQIFVLPAEGSTPRQLTSGPYHHDGRPRWTPDGSALVFSANRHEDWRNDPLNSEIYKVSVADGAITALTDRAGPDENPAVSPDGKLIAYTGFDDRLQGYQVQHLYVMNADGSGKRALTVDFDRDVDQPQWSADGTGIVFVYDENGNSKVGSVSLDGKVKTLAKDVGGLSLDRPYSGGSMSLAKDGRFAFTESRPDHPADVAVGKPGAEAARVTHLNEDLLGPKELGAVEEIWYPSSFDSRKIQGWIVRPPGFDPKQKYPLILEIHGGPFANYGDRFAVDMQLYAAAGYVVLYTNPRGSTSYGEEFGNLIHHAYPSHDYEDLMSGVDAVAARGFVDTDNLFVTGGSGGGVLTAWIVGKTNRFRAAVVAKPVINWTSFVLTSDSTSFFAKYWFSAPPWEHPEEYQQRSPLSYVGNVTTPTMLISGESDYRTPISEAEQFYQALKLRKVDAALVRVPEASHEIATRPSQMMEKALYVMQWFEKHKKAPQQTAAAGAEPNGGR